jgi:hypothetical protein
MMAGGKPAGAVGGRSYRQDEHGAGEEVPDRELAEPHFQRARHQRGREEHRQAPPLLVDGFSLSEGFLTPFQDGPRVFKDPPAPAVADLIAQQPADLVADDGGDEHRGDVQLSLAGERG